MMREPFVKIDSHAHLTSDELYPNADRIIERAIKEGVTKIVNINTDRSTFERAKELQKKYPEYIFNTVATTPHDVEKEGEENFAYFETAIRQGEVVAVGEVGLDYYYEYSNREIQKEFVKRYFDLACAVKLPVVIHCRGDDAFRDLFSFQQPILAVLHCFTGNQRQAEQAIERGWYVSVSGIATFKKSEALRQVIKQLPLNRLFIETDAPYLAPQSRRGKVNEPAYITETAQTIASVHNISLEEVCLETTENARKFFAL